MRFTLITVAFKVGNILNLRLFKKMDDMKNTSLNHNIKNILLQEKKIKLFFLFP